eukprot:1649078-Amphidinium_carterae.1
MFEKYYVFRSVHNIVRISRKFGQHLHKTVPEDWRVMFHSNEDNNTNHVKLNQSTCVQAPGMRFKVFLSAGSAA